MNHIDYLKSIGACQREIELAAKFSSLSEAWEHCEHSPYMFWLLRATGNITKEQAVDIAIQCAERALPSWEKKHPEDTLSRKAIDSAKAWLKEPTEANRLAAGKAYSDAFDAADAYAANDAEASAAYAYAAFAASFSAYAAASDADAAAATYAAASATYAAYVDANAALTSDERKAQADIIRAVVGNPFKS